MIKLIIVEDHALFRLGLTSALSSDKLEISIIGEAEDAKSLFTLLETCQPDLIILDILLPDISGIEVARQLRKDYPEIKILAISSENTLDIVHPLLDIGIHGFISKNQSTSDDLLEAIESIMNGFEYFGRDIASVIYNVYVAKKRTENILYPFTNREKDIIALCKDGLLSKEIAERLRISPRTVEVHKNNIFKKLGINSTMELTLYALKYDIISLR
ncbi:response regulator transcription factor [Bacteroidales bacterium OttesenSCG-928-K03]|nr:response regulator transcription factor [Odoribacter sp. OttesenSCG-928-L07]MDL2239351.1 response regulator transcription factor [Bacteroidales bacterium OttesenSCG-928-L14]MDL2240748.1 response regulator transcription factor [Bacteroidales bacterium OttesenSCG-928-K22]MDL2242243.1 response regulator transcription factor [Bacteroidales bacterium OttesenSCG-928-K03]